MTEDTQVSRFCLITFGLACLVVKIFDKICEILTKIFLVNFIDFLDFFGQICLCYSFVG